MLRARLYMSCLYNTNTEMSAFNKVEQSDKMSMSDCLCWRAIGDDFRTLLT